MLEDLKQSVLSANLELVKQGLVLYTFGNVSGIDRDKGIVAIKPSGVDYDSMTADDIVLVDLDGKRVEGKYNPSSDLATHLELYKAFGGLGGVAHSHSKCATAWAQAGRPIPCYGTTHADYAHGDIPVTRRMTKSEIGGEYEKNTGVVMIEGLSGKDALELPGMLVFSHGPFSWGKDAAEAAYNAAIMEYVADIALKTERVNSATKPAAPELMDKHYYRKHGANAYYGQLTIND